MKTYKYVERVLSNGEKFFLIAELNGSKRSPGTHTVATSKSEDDAKMIVSALNAAAGGAK